MATRIGSLNMAPSSNGLITPARAVNEANAPSYVFSWLSSSTAPRADGMLSDTGDSHTSRRAAAPSSSNSSMYIGQMNMPYMRYVPASSMVTWGSDVYSERNHTYPLTSG